MAIQIEKKNDVLELLTRLRNHFGAHSPTAREIRAFLDPATGLGLAALLVALWQYFFPDGEPRKRKIVCQKLNANEKPCDAEFVHKTLKGKVLTLVCAKGHRTTIRVK